MNVYVGEKLVDWVVYQPNIANTWRNKIDYIEFILRRDHDLDYVTNYLLTLHKDYFNHGVASKENFTSSTYSSVGVYLPDSKINPLQYLILKYQESEEYSSYSLHRKNMNRRNFKRLSKILQEK